MNNRSVPNELFFQEVKELLEAGKKVKMHVQGNSMRPFLRNGDKVILVPPSSLQIKKGIVVLTGSSIGIVLHRIIQMDGDCCLLAGDAHSKQVEKAFIRDIIGIVTEVNRCGNNIRLDSPYSRFLSFLWEVLRPFRGIMFRCYDMLNTNKIRK